MTQTKPEWYNSNNLHDMKRQRRRLERRFLKSGLHMDKKRYNDFCIIYHGALDSAKRNYFSDRIENSDCKYMFRIVQSLSEPKSARILPDHDNPETLAEDFARSFHTKIANIRTNGRDTTKGCIFVKARNFFRKIIEVECLQLPFVVIFFYGSLNQIKTW